MDPRALKTGYFAGYSGTSAEHLQGSPQGLFRALRGTFANGCADRRGAQRIKNGGVFDSVPPLASASWVCK